MTVVPQLEFLNLIRRWLKTMGCSINVSNLVRSVSCSSTSPLPFPAILQSEEAIGLLYCGGQVDIDSLDPVDTGSAVTCSTRSPEEVAGAIKAMVIQVDEISYADRGKFKLLLCEFSDVFSVGVKDLA